MKITDVLYESDDMSETLMRLLQDLSRGIDYGRISITRINNIERGELGRITWIGLDQAGNPLRDDDENELVRGLLDARVHALVKKALPKTRLTSIVNGLAMWQLKIEFEEPALPRAAKTRAALQGPRKMVITLGGGT